MFSNNKVVKTVGVLFIVQMVAAVFSHSIVLEPILYKSNFLTELSVNSSLVTMAIISDLICGASVFAIAVLLFPIFKSFSERVALWYIGQRLTELVGFMISGFLLLTLLSMGQSLTKEPVTDISNIEELARYFRNARGNIQNISLLLYCLGAWPFYGLLFHSKLIPRFISIWGLIGVTLLFIEILSNIFNTSVGGMLIMMPLGINEIFLGIWLIVKGVNSTPPSSEVKI